MSNFPAKTRYTCATCGSDEVFTDAFASLNNPADVRLYDDTWCMACEASCSVIETTIPFNEADSHSCADDEASDGIDEIAHSLHAGIAGGFSEDNP